MAVTLPSTPHSIFCHISRKLSIQSPKHPIASSSSIYLAKAFHSSMKTLLQPPIAVPYLL
jgi:hypothetical protein